ncbi:protein INVOLVED IN DE NOVO 2-like [Papaver somniferum]|uniref:protein INVOLVED IN DE NOVO 2-like n=1 Tax=Papaver somniferum TaxID=3469 RepID=UPI000E6F7512|nr:protein INVOLVED IN DE NOVO 2-like [Papaver somniferum]
MAIVEFTNDLSGFRDAMTFESVYNSYGRGKRHYCGDQLGLGGMYGWVAREGDYYSDSVLGKNLRNSDLKTIKDVQAEYVRKNEQLVTNLVHLVDEKNDNLERVKLELNEISYSLKNLTERFEFQKQELKIRSEELEKVKAQSESDKEKEKRKNAMKNSKLEMAELEYKKNVLRMAEEQKRVKEAHLRERIEEEKKLDAKDKLELEVELLRGQLKALTYMADDDADLESKKKVEELTKDLKEEI